MHFFFEVFCRDCFESFACPALSIKVKLTLHKGWLLFYIMSSVFYLLEVLLTVVLMNQTHILIVKKNKNSYGILDA